MKLSILLSGLFLCDSVQAELEGDYELISGPMECPTGRLQTIVVAENKTRVLLFGSRPAWPLDMKDVSEIKEVVKGGCTYVSAYEKSENQFVNKTTRSQCPSKKNDGVVTETIILQDIELIYEFHSEQTKFKCQYKKVLESGKN